jgi:nitrite reductase (NADH) small subunit
MQIARRESSEDEASHRGPAPEAGVWVRVCRLDDIAPNTGVGALLGQRQVALVRVHGAGAAAEVYAISNFDPFSKAFVLARGIVGDRQGVPKIASPIFKQSFDLRTGVCLDDPTVKVPTFAVRVEGGVVELFQPAEPSS